MMGNARERNGSATIVSPSLNCRMKSWQVVVSFCGPWAMPLIMNPHDAADALAAVVVERDGPFALLDETLVQDVEQLQERHVPATSSIA